MRSIPDFTVFFLVSCVFAWPRQQHRAGTSGPETPPVQGQAAGTIGFRCRPPAAKYYTSDRTRCISNRSFSTYSCHAFCAVVRAEDSMISTSLPEPLQRRAQHSQHPSQREGLLSKR